MRLGTRLSFLLGMVLLFPGFLAAATFFTNTYTDISDPTPDGLCDSCSLREAIQEANFLAGPDMIFLPPGTYSMDIAGADEDACLTGDLDIMDDVSIIGIGTTGIESHVGRIIHVISGNVSITGLTLTQGDAANDQNTGQSGGAIYNAGSSTLTLNNCTMTQNVAKTGGGIFNGGTLTLNGSTLTSNNSQGSDFGGAVYNSGTMSVINSTFTDNFASGGGAIHSTAGSTLIINNSTISANSSTGGVGGGGINVAPGSSVTLSNTIIANNTSSGPNKDCDGTVTSGGSNIVEVATGCTGLTGTGDVTGTDPLLGPLQNNGGRTLTFGLQPLSPALNTGGQGTSVCELLDQRGLLRPQDTACEIGAFEFNPTCTGVTLAPTTLTDGTTGTFYTQLITPTGGTAPFTYAVTSGTLPPGFALNSATGELSGVPTGTGTFNFTITAFDVNLCPGSFAYSINILAGPSTCGGGVTITLSPTLLASGALSQAYNQQLLATGGLAPHQFTVTGGILPPGLVLDPTTGVISGTPTVSGTFVFVATATDANNCTGVQPYTIQIACALTVIPTTIPTLTEGVLFSQLLTPAGGTAPYTFAVVNGALPPGMTLTGAGLLSGTPTLPGTYTFLVEFTDANYCTGTQGYIVLVNPCIQVSPTSLPDGVVGTAYAATLTPTGGAGAITFSTLDILPDGILMDASGNFTGTPTTPGTYLFTVTATDGTCTKDFDYFIIVNPVGCPIITITPATLPGALVGDNYSQNLTANGGSGGYTFQLLTGFLPPDLTLGTNGSISGTVNASGAYTFTVGATDSSGCAGSQSYTLVTTPTTCPAIEIFPPILPDGGPGVAYNQTLIGTGGIPPYVYALTGGALPDGLLLDGLTGVISGTPTLVGIYNFQITATDVTGCSGFVDYTVEIFVGGGGGGGGGGTCATYGDDFADNTLATDWAYIKPGWSETAGNLVGTPSGKKAIAVAQPAFAGCVNCAFETTISTSGDPLNKVWFLAWYVNKANTIEVLMASDTDKWLLKQKIGGVTITKKKATKVIDPNVFYMVRVVFDGTKFDLFVDDMVTPLITMNSAGTVPSGTTGFQVKLATASFGYICVD